MKKSTNTGSALKTWLKNAFTKNLALKIVSLIFAMLLWGYVLMSENPQRTKTLTNVPISVEGVSWYCPAIRTTAALPCA